jgi:hypothetical protein
MRRWTTEHRGGGLRPSRHRLHTDGLYKASNLRAHRFGGEPDCTRTIELYDLRCVNADNALYGSNL